MLLSKLLISVMLLSAFVNDKTNNPHETKKELIQKEDILLKEGDILERKNVLNGMLSILLPKSFTLMSSEEKRLKYPGQNAPQEVWANEDRDVSVGFSNTGHPLPESEMDMYVQQVAKGVKQNLPDSKWYGVSTYLTAQVRTFLLIIQIFRPSRSFMKILIMIIVKILTVIIVGKEELKT